MLRAERLVRNQAFFRDVNEEIASALPRLGFVRPQDDQFTILCECGSRECYELIPITPAEYEDLRSGPNRFAVAPGHEVETIEEILSAGERFLVVAKIHPEPIEVAEARDPRAGARAPESNQAVLRRPAR